MPGSDDGLIEAVRLQVQAARARRTGRAPPDGAIRTKDGGLETAGADWRAWPLESPPGYRLVGEIHRGGQGVVFQAVQNSTGRTVAVKIIRLWPLASPHDVARFQREVQILSQLDHPHIVGIIDSGLAAGHLYFVMDFIAGQALDEWAGAASAPSGAPPTPWAAQGSSSAPSAAQRGRGPGRAQGRQATARFLGLFAKICDAVHAAHLRGVIHRDLKPSNIRIDPGGEPHVLDFGLAKQLGPADGAADPATVTESGQFLGSLPWTSPEQAGGTAADVDIRTDVYSLGVILYRMLAGRFPYDVAGPWREVVERIVHEEPRRPAIDDELDTITLKCLQKDRGRRYQSAGELASDVRRYLNGEPIEAKGDSLAYLLKTQLRRHRAAVAAAAAFLILIVAALAVTANLWRRAAEQRDRAVAAQTLALLRQQEAQNVSRLIESMLSSADPQTGQTHGYTVRQMLDDFDAQLGDTLVDQPQVEAHLRLVMGKAYAQLAEYDRAEQQLRGALDLNIRLHGPQSSDVASNLLELAAELRDSGQLSAAQETLGEARAICERTSPGSEGHAQTLNQLGEMALRRGEHEEAETLLRESLAMAEQIEQPQSPVAASCMHYLASLLADRGEHEQADELFARAVQAHRQHAGPRSPDVAVTLSDWGVALMTRGELDAAEEKTQAALELSQSAYGDDHVRIAPYLDSLGIVMHKKGRLPEAEDLMRRALDLRQRFLGESHPNVAASLNNLGTLLCDQGDAAGAVEHLRRAVEIEAQHYPDPRSERARALNNLARAEFMSGDPESAAGHLREALSIDRQLWNDDHPDVQDDRRGLAHVLESRGEVDAAITVVRELLASYARTRPADDPGTQANRLWLAALLARCGAGRLQEEAPGEAREVLEESLAIRRERLPSDDWRIAMSASLLGEALCALHRDDQALPLLEEGWSGLRTASAAPPGAARAAGERLAKCCAARGDMDRAEIVRAQAAETAPAE